MNWFPGAGDPCFVQYAEATGALLGGSGAILVPLRLWRRTAERARGAFRAWASWLVMAPAILLLLGLGRAVFVGAVALLSLLLVREFARATRLDEDRGLLAAVYAAAFAAHVLAWVRLFGPFLTVPVFAVALLPLVPIWRNAHEGMLPKVALAIFAVLYLGWFPAHLAWLANADQRYALVLFLVVGTELNDASAFCAGKLLAGKVFARRPLVSRISPGKTVQGTLGALLVVAAYVWATRGLLPAAAPGAGPDGPWVWALFAVVLWVGGSLGDLVISVVKRESGVKDMGTLIPGHGGLLDRFDSLVFTAPMFFHLVRYVLHAA